MEGRKLLDANVFVGRHEIAKPVITKIIVTWVFEIFVYFLSFFFFLSGFSLTTFHEPQNWRGRVC